MMKIKEKFGSFFRRLLEDDYQRLTLKKVIIFAAVLNSVLQIALVRVHNQAAFMVHSVVAIVSFFYIITILMCVMNAFRLDERYQSYLMAIVAQVISLI